MSTNVGLETPFSIMQLPNTWLSSLCQHIASGPMGLASAAALSQTCKSMHALSESSAVGYRDIHVEQPISSPNHPLWRWLATRHGRFHGLNVQILLDANLEEQDLVASTPAWEQPLQTLAAIHTRDHPLITQWLGHHRSFIDHLTAEVDADTDELTLREFCKAAASCRSLDLCVIHTDGTLNLSTLAPVASSLVQLSLYIDCGVPADFGGLEHFHLSQT